MSDIFIYQRIKEYANVERLDYMPNNKWIKDALAYEVENEKLNTLNKTIPFDMFLMNYIFSERCSYDVRQKALQVMIKNFN